MKNTFQLSTWDEISSKLDGSKDFRYLNPTQGFLQI